MNNYLFTFLKQAFNDAETNQKVRQSRQSQITHTASTKASIKRVLQTQGDIDNECKTARIERNYLMTKQIEDYPLPQNLEAWLNMWNAIPKARARAQFVEMQKQIDSLTEQNKELKANMEIVADMATKDNLGRYFHLAARTKGSLAEHDKQVRDKFVDFVIQNHLLSGINPRMIKEVLNVFEQLKDSNND